MIDSLQPSGELRITSEEEQIIIAQNLGEAGVILDAEEDV